MEIIFNKNEGTSQREDEHNTDILSESVQKRHRSTFPSSFIYVIKIVFRLSFYSLIFNQAVNAVLP